MSLQPKSSAPSGPPNFRQEHALHDIVDAGNDLDLVLGAADLSPKMRAIRDGISQLVRQAKQCVLENT